MQTHPILLATVNPAKQGRLGWLLEGLALEPTTPAQMGLGEGAPAEPGVSHEENARLKAQSWSSAAGMLAISTDGGLVVPALGDRWESLLTHRSAGDDAGDEARLEHLLRIMRPYRGLERRASWVEALAIAMEGRVLASWQVEGATGTLLENPGPGPEVPGFWVFPVWYFPDLGKTYNELNERELVQLDDHWSQLRTLVQRFFHGDASSPR